MADEDRIARIARALCIADDNNPDAEFTLVTNITNNALGERPFHELTAPVWTSYVGEARQIVASMMILIVAEHVIEKLRTIIFSSWMTGAIGVLAAVLHLYWYIAHKVAGKEALSSFGTVLVMLGIFVGARPYFRFRRSGLIARGLSKERAALCCDPTYEALMKTLHAEARLQGTCAVWAERVVAAASIVIGNLLSGLSSLVARLLHKENV